MVNKVILIGNLGRDPEARSTASGHPVTNLSLATHRRWTDAEGQRQEATEWHRIVVFGRQAEVAGQYLARGRKLYVEGRIQYRSWDDKNTGERRYATEIVCESFQMLGQRERTGEDEAAGDAAAAAAEPGGEDDDIRF